MDRIQIVEKLSQMRGGIPLPASLTRRSFVGAAGAAAATTALAGATTALAANAPAASTAGDAPAAPASSGQGMTFSGNEGKTMGEVLGAGWLGEEPEIAADQITEMLTTNIVICGAGHAGTACARKAAELGTKVIVVDLQPEDGFMVLGNDVGHLNSKWQTERMGVPVYDIPTFMNEYQICCANRAQPTLLSQFANRSGEAFDWLIEGLSEEEKDAIICLNWPVIDGYNYQKGIFHSYVGTPNFGGVGTQDTSLVSLQEVVLRSQQVAKDAGAQFIYETTAVRLVHNDDNSEVTGVICQKADGSYVQIDAKAVVLACGDIGTNSPMYNALCHEAYGLGEYKDCSAGSGRDGSGIAMAMRIGAKVEIGTGGDMSVHAPMFLSPLGGAETLWLNEYGKRFCNEAYGGPLLSAVAASRLPGNLIYSIWDADWKTVLLNQIAAHMTQKAWDEISVNAIGDQMEAAKGSGADGYDAGGKMLYCADTLEELFQYMGMEEGCIANAVKAVETWNAAAEAGVDNEFGRDPEMI